MPYAARKLLLVSSALLLSLAGAILAARAQSGAQGAPAAKTASQEFKNIQILKDIPADQLIPAMQFMTASLGVDCQYCHVERAFDKDDKKPKQFARHMMEMVFTINKDNFEGQRWVTCYSCHRGSPKPIAVPLISAGERHPEAEETASATGLPAPESLLDAYLAAVGGAKNLAGIRSRVAKGTVTAFGDQRLPIDIYSQAPDKRISVMHVKDGESVTAYNGKVGWLSVPGRVHWMNAQEAAGARMDADLAFAASVRGLYPKWETKAGEKIEGRETWLVVGTREGQPPLELYLDQKSGLLVRLVRYADSPLGYNPTQIDYADYRPADGVKVPYRWTVARPGNRFTVQLEQLEQNVPVEERRFAPPPESPAK